MPRKRLAHLTSMRRRVMCRGMDQSNDPFFDLQRRPFFDLQRRLCSMADEAELAEGEAERALIHAMAAYCARMANNPQALKDLIVDVVTGALQTARGIGAFGVQSQSS